jgi:hypothetical protein
LRAVAVLTDELLPAVIVRSLFVVVERPTDCVKAEPARVLTDFRAPIFVSVLSILEAVLATLRAEVSASFKLRFPQTGGVFIDLYFIGLFCVYMGGMVKPVLIGGPLTSESDNPFLCYFVIH